MTDDIKGSYVCQELKARFASLIDARDRNQRVLEALKVTAAKLNVEIDECIEIDDTIALLITAAADKLEQLDA